jgi:tetratricopeptide (TPR) repeat protein
MQQPQNNAQKTSKRATHAQEIPEQEQILVYIQQEKWSEVVNLLKPYLEHNPYNGDYWRYYGIANEKLGHYEKACSAYGKAVECGSNYLAEATYQLGRVLARLGRGDEALKWLEVSLHNSQ